MARIYILVSALGVLSGGAAWAAPVDFAHEIAPLLSKHCGKCHANGRYEGDVSFDTREALLEPIDQVRATSLDPYTTLRSAYRQRRGYEIRNEEERGRVVGPSGVTGFGQGVTGPAGPDARPPTQ